GWRGLRLASRTMVMEAPQLTYGPGTASARRTICKSAQPKAAEPRPGICGGCARVAARAANSARPSIAARCSQPHAVVMTLSWPVAAAGAIFVRRGTQSDGGLHADQQDDALGWIGCLRRRRRYAPHLTRRCPAEQATCLCCAT